MLLRKVLCYGCSKPVSNREDLITAYYFFRIKPFHSHCYGKRLRTIHTLFLKNYPVNSLANNISVAFSTGISVFFLALLLTNPSKFPQPGAAILLFFVLLLQLPLLARLYSYYKFEKPLAK